MPQLLALEWNSREVRVVVGSERDRQVVIEHAFTVPWNADGAETGEPEQLIANRITEELTSRGIECQEVLVAVGRSSIELRQLQLPPAPDADLPDMVQFQASREFNELDEKWLLDFVPIDVAADGARTVLAMAIAPAMIKVIEAVCEKAGLKMRRLLLRSCEAASLLAGDKTTPPEQLRLLVDMLADEGDLTAVADGKAIFLRTTRFSSDPPPVPALLAEIRLTVAAVQNQLGGRTIASIVLCGRDNMHADLVRGIETELGLHVQMFDPFSAVELTPAMKRSPPAHPGRFAPLLGMLVAELKQTGHAIDFLHPRRRPEAPNRRKKWILAGASVLLLGFAYLVYCRIDSSLLASEVDTLRVQSKALDDAIKRTKKESDNAKEIKRWVDADVNWLDQLYGLNQSLPAKEDAVLGELNCSSGQAGSTMDVKGWVLNQKVLAKMGETVRAQVGPVTLKTQKEDQSVRPYTWHFEAVVLPKKALAEAVVPAKKGQPETPGTSTKKAKTETPNTSTKDTKSTKAETPSTSTKDTKSTKAESPSTSTKDAKAEAPPPSAKAPPDAPAPVKKEAQP